MLSAGCLFRRFAAYQTRTAYSGRKTISAGVIALLAAACGSYAPPGSASAPTAPSAPVPTTVTITVSGVSPKEVTVAVGGRVTFVNNDTIPHDVAGGPDPANPDCREIDAVGFLTPGQSRQTAPLPSARTCEYHDHGFHSPLFNGRIVVR
jgi:plastocyanin